MILDSLKRCPLCEAVNAESSDACFVCGWAGAFDREPDEVQASFEALVAQCPALADMVAPGVRRRGFRAWASRLLGRKR
ncbi:hypothetical protein EON82_20850 [bacterium]|nr:MAG: hypothetical protein EON82_20850 [bacterium]